MLFPDEVLSRILESKKRIQPQTTPASSLILAKFQTLTVEILHVLTEVYIVVAVIVYSACGTYTLRHFG